MIYIFLDSNIYIGKKYNLESSYFVLLKQLLKNSAFLLYSNINVNEVFKHLELDVKKAVEEYTVAQANFYKSYAHFGTFKYKKINVNDEINNLKNYFNEFWNKENVIKIPSNGIDVEKILQDHFNSRPPFIGKKPYEFKDAIMIDAVNKYAEQNNVTIYFISNDKGVLKALEDKPLLKGYSSFEAFSNDEYIKSKYDLSIKTLLSEYIQTDSFGSLVKNALDMAEIIRTGDQDYEINNCNCKNIELLINFATHESLDNITAEIIIKVNYSLELLYLDKSNYIYNPAIRSYYNPNISITEEHQKEIALSLKFILKYNSTFELADPEELVAELTSIELDDESLINLPVTDAGLDFLDSLPNSFYDDVDLDEVYGINESACCERCGSFVDINIANLSRELGKDILCETCITDYSADDEYNY